MKLSRSNIVNAGLILSLVLMNSGILLHHACCDVKLSSSTKGKTSCCCNNSTAQNEDCCSATNEDQEKKSSGNASDCSEQCIVSNEYLKLEIDQVVTYKIKSERIYFVENNFAIKAKIINNNTLLSLPNHDKVPVPPWGKNLVIILHETKIPFLLSA